MESNQILNIYGQEAWHTDAQIVGSPLALQALKDALGRAIQNGYSEIGDEKGDGNPLFASDGEGYLLKITCIGNWDDPRWKWHLPEYAITRSPTPNGEGK